MDMKEKIEELWAKITADDGVLEQFKDDPIKTVESLLGIDLPDEKLREVAAAIKAKVDMDAIDAKLDVFAALGGECGAMAWIKTTKDRRTERVWQLQDQAREEQKQQDQ